MPWPSIDRNQPKEPQCEGQLLPDALRQKILAFSERYERKKGALIPGLTMIQDSFGFISYQAMEELAEILEVPACEVFDVVTFYTHFWTHKRGTKTIMVCRSLTCEVMGSNPVLVALKQHLGVDEHETTPDGAYSLCTEECLGQCEHAPCVLINEKRHSHVKPEDIPALLADPNNDKLNVPRSDIYDGVAGSH